MSLTWRIADRLALNPASEACVVVKAALILLLCVTSILTKCANAQTWQVKGQYRDPALGYSFRIPSGLSAASGISGTGVQRGVEISTPSGGRITVWGEPNSLEWKTPSEGVKWALKSGECTSEESKPSRVLIGRLKGAQGKAICRTKVRITFLVFRPGGEPIYWFELTTPPDHEHEDKSLLEQIAASFKIIRWK